MLFIDFIKEIFEFMSRLCKAERAGVDGSIWAILPNYFKPLFPIILEHGSNFFLELISSFFTIVDHRSRPVY